MRKKTAEEAMAEIWAIIGYEACESDNYDVVVRLVGALKRLAEKTEPMPAIPMSAIYGGCMDDWGPDEYEEWIRKTDGMTDEQKRALGLQNLRTLLRAK